MWFVIIGGSMIDFPSQSRAVALRAEMHGYALMAEKTEDVMAVEVNYFPWHLGCMISVKAGHSFQQFEFMHASFL